MQQEFLQFSNKPLIDFNNIFNRFTFCEHIFHLFLESGNVSYCLWNKKGHYHGRAYINDVKWQKIYGILKSCCRIHAGNKEQTPRHGRCHGKELESLLNSSS
jgi:hypothetical protein